RGPHPEVGDQVGDDEGAHEHHPAHGGRALLVEVALHLLLDELPDRTPPEEGDRRRRRHPRHDQPHGSTDEEGDHREPLRDASTWRATSRSSKGMRSPPTSWWASWPFPMMSTA